MTEWEFLSGRLWTFIPVLWSVLVVFFTLPALIIFKNWLRMFLMVRRLPGPKGHPILGNAAEFLSKHKFFYHASKWREKFSSFHKTLILFHPLIIVQSPEAIQAILSRKHKHNEKGIIYRGLRPLLGEGLITSSGERWHSHRKLITPTFHFNILDSFVDVFVARTNDFMAELHEEVDEKNSEFIDISPFTRKLTLDFICETAMGAPVKSTATSQKEIVAAMHKLEEIGTYRMVRPWLLSDFIFQFTAKGKEQDKYTSLLKNFTNKVIMERRKVMLEQSKVVEVSYSKKRAIFVDLLIESSDNGKLLTDADIREEVNTFMFAGQNTTQLAINYCLYLLGNYPEIQRRAMNEQDEIFGDSDRDPTMDDLKSMKYLDLCIKDALRLFPSVPVIARRLTEDEVMDKHILPRGADVLILPYVLHRDPKQFPNPEEFNPDNFLPENIKNRHPYAYIPFSAGSRNCLGQKFAVLAEKTVISAILRKFQITSRDSREELIVVPNTVLVPKNGIKLKIEPRNKQFYSPIL